jgi:hypothetical protein
VETRLYDVLRVSPDASSSAIKKGKDISESQRKKSTGKERGERERFPEGFFLKSLKSFFVLLSSLVFYYVTLLVVR